MAEELKACPFCGETLRINNARLAVHSRNSECLLRQQPIVVDDKDQVERWNTRATHPAAASVGGGEAVAVVAYIDGGGAIYTAKLLEIMSVEPDGCEPLMTVAQHQRILAAATHPAGQVAEGVVVPIKLLKIIEQSWRIPNGCPKSVSEEVGEIISNGLAELRALLAKSEGVKK